MNVSDIRQGIASYLVGSGIVAFASSFMDNITTPLLNMTKIGELGNIHIKGLGVGAFISAIIQFLIILLITWALTR